MDGNAQNNCEGTDCDATFATVDECVEAHVACQPSLCRDTGGMWRFWGECDCDFACGVNGLCRGCEGPSCDCGPWATFDEALGCVESDACERDQLEPPRELCVRTGGEWGPFCGHSSCGVPSPLNCTAMACDCPGPTMFDDVRGCIEVEACYLGGGRCDYPGVECPLGFICGRTGFCEEQTCD